MIAMKRKEERKKNSDISFIYLKHIPPLYPSEFFRIISLKTSEKYLNLETAHCYLTVIIFSQISICNDRPFLEIMELPS